MKLLLATCGAKPNGHLANAFAACGFVHDLDGDLAILCRHDDRAALNWANTMRAFLPGAELEKLKTEPERFPGRAAMARNATIARRATHAVVVWDGRSATVKHLVDVCRRQHVDVFLYRSDLNPIVSMQLPY